MTGQGNFWSGWGERLSALRNIPPVLRIVWESGPRVIVFGLIFRLLVSVLPVALLWVAKLIIDGIVATVERHQPLMPHFWWLVGTEFALAVCGSLFSRAIDYFDALLADKYTRHVSIEVMKHAADLDLLTYEDPVFYDRLERARVQATDRLGMIQSMGRLIQQVITAVSLSVSILLYLALAAAAADRRCRPRISRREPFRFSGLCQELSPDPDPPPAGLPARAGRQPRGGQGTEAIWAEGISGGPFH